MTPRGEDRKQEIIEALVALVHEKLPEAEAPRAEAFVRRFYRNVAPFDLEHRELLDLYGAALSHYRFGHRRKPGEPKLRAYNPRIEQHGWQSTHTIVELVNDDMPFLVDSTSMALSRHGLGIHLVIHPLLRVRRDARGRLTEVLEGTGGKRALTESWMHFEVDRHSDRAFLARLEQDIARTLGDVRRAVEDWKPMCARIEAAIAGLPAAARHVEAEDLEEIEAFLRWLADDHFILLGYAAYLLEEDPERGVRLRREPDTALGILRGYGPSEYSRSFEAMPPEMRERAREPRPVIMVTKANTKSTVHRPAYLDYIGVKRYDRRGRVIGEYRFLGLFTSAAYNRSPLSIPLLRRKIERVVVRAGLDRRSHAGKALLNILETYPRDELFQIDEDELLEIATNILYLQDRLQIRLFLRKDPYGRFVSCLVYVPRERYNTALRRRFEAILCEALGSEDAEYQAQVSEALLARILFVVRTPKGIPEDLDPEALERRLVEAAHDWSDRLYTTLLDVEGEELGNLLFRRYGHGFPTAYQEVVPARAAVADIIAIHRLATGEEGPLALRLYRRLEDPEDLLHFRIIRPERPVHLSDALPILENMGVRVLSEQPFEVRSTEGDIFWIHDFLVQIASGESVAVDDIRDKFQSTFLAVWNGSSENDGFNRLVLAAGLDADEITVLRAYCKYMRQIGSPFSQAYIERTFAANGGIARRLAALFAARFDPDLAEKRRERRSAELVTEILGRLEQVAVLDEDRILRTHLGLVQATLRTNAFQDPPEDGERRPYLALKFDPARVPGMPAPRPTYEIFVYAPHVEAVHLRGGKVARGGIRWSDRREDFRTEILGLMKAQMVKNAIIVPVGAKGGFVVKRPPAGGDRQALLEEGIRCYRTFLRGMLDITDNQRGGEVVPPPRVVRYDDDDPYLVVAADKGTATFSDIANAISREYGFWLDDAFASGGSAGYDHKKMGITARGAWESVKRHFRELGIDPLKDPFTVVGIGDMSGDVFGNGMLLSDRIRLIAAFDHRHIFVDPDPDPAVSFAERKRLFALPRSSWEDYDRDLISEGGGVWRRSAKRIPLSPQMRAALAIDAEQLTPNELVSAILRAPVDLLWNGGVGTFVKARAESHADAQDRSNDAVRVDAEELRCKVVGEGGNLGFTQRARIAFAAAGGRINTDFIDNSAGVSCSDHEVNIKILLREVMEAGEITLKQRDALLAEMTDEVAELVLRDNVLQNLALSVGQTMAEGMTDARQRLMRKLEERGRLDRALEFLPSDQEILARRRRGGGLTRPEAAVLLAYAKTTLYEDLLRSPIPDRPYFLVDLRKYFPRPLRRRFPDQIADHRLRREIIATWIANSIINRGLEVFVSEMEDETGADLTDITLAFVIARDAFALLPVWGEVETLGYEVAAEHQLAILAALRDTLAAGTRWFLAHAARPLGIRETVGRFRPGIARVIDSLEEVLASSQTITFSGTVAAYAEAGLPRPLARQVSALPLFLPASDIVAAAQSWQPERAVETIDYLAVARIYFALSAVLDIAWLSARLRRAPAESRWDRLALTGLEEELSNVLRRLTLACVEEIGVVETPDAVRERVESWLETRLHGILRYRRLLADLKAAPAPALSMLSVAVRSLSDLRVVRSPD